MKGSGGTEGGFLDFVIGVFSLFVDASRKWACRETHTVRRPGEPPGPA